MEKITRNVRDLENNERQTYEGLLGHSLRENQQIIIQVISLGEQSGELAAHTPSGRLPDWCNVYDGLSEDEIEEVENVIFMRADLTRPS